MDKVIDKKYKIVKFGKREIIENRKRSLTEMVFIFTICSMLGYLVETAYVYLSVGRIVKRGMLMGPYCPIYGFGALILYILFYNLKPTKANIPYTFITASITMGAFELLSGLAFKHILNIEMWNYSGHFLSILDYTTVPILIGWGILGTIYVFFIHRLLLKVIEIVPKHITKRIAIFLVVMYFADFAMSVYRISGNPDILYKLVNP